MKSKIFGFIDQFRLARILYFVQKNITGTAKFDYLEPQRDWILHKEAIERSQSYSLLEFGAGKSLAQNLYLSKYISNQIVVDINRMIDLNLVNQAYLQISKITNNDVLEFSSLEDLRKKLGILYLAPYDLLSSSMQEDSIDCCISTATLEHIPKVQIDLLFKAIKKIIKPNGTLSFVIDYTDHYSYADKEISNLNFLKYDEHEFQKYNHGCHYQNRLRHSDFEEIFENHNFIIEKSSILERGYLPSRISENFTLSNTIDATVGYFLLRNKK